MANTRSSVPALVLLLLGTLGYFLFAFTWFSHAAYLNPIVRDLGLSSTEAGLVTGAVQLTYIPLSLFSGLIIDRIGSRKSLSIGLLIVGSAHILRGMSTNFVSVLIPTLLLGTGGTAVTFGLPKLVSELFPPDAVGRMSSIYTIGSTLGSATVFAVSRPLVSMVPGGWRQIFLYTGLTVILFSVGWFGVSWWLWARVDPTISPDSESSADQSFSMTSVKTDLLKILSHYGLLLLVVVGTMRLFINHALSNWLPVVLSARGMGSTIASTLTSLLILSRVIGIATIPTLSDRFSTRRFPIIACGLGGTLGVAGLIFGQEVLILSLSLVLIGTFAIGGPSPLIRAIPTEMDNIGPRLTAVANGLIFTVGQIGGFLGPFSIGTVYDLTGSFQIALLGVAGATVLMTIAGYAMAEP